MRKSLVKISVKLFLSDFTYLITNYGLHTDPLSLGTKGLTLKKTSFILIKYNLYIYIYIYICIYI
jgi:hypothetical protein